MTEQATELVSEPAADHDETLRAFRVTGGELQRYPASVAPRRDDEVVETVVLEDCLDGGTHRLVIIDDENCEGTHGITLPGAEGLAAAHAKPKDITVEVIDERGTSFMQTPVRTSGTSASALSTASSRRRP